ncbi:NmrA family NAD(P)-binding protein [Brevibacterium sp. JSBI002]|uniref:NmrA family NAD(P)-binding protein n=1 Tax=Brevibacterium sp. JSBI002 TaxID=2886045 RepID=UPI002231858E|nr:NmrA family NAD(P)-binding protein [Brevibacterium sp. JSBI002]UZD62201.1 NmrA family NAD(P)-binding protein [Brevibacterium sp. JSBI002]
MKPQARADRIGIVSGTGKTGRAVAAAVSSAGGVPVTLGRADLADPITALQGCRSVYLMAPNLHSDEVGFIEMLLGACHAAGVERIVYHSVASPYAPAMPHHLAKAESEDRVRRSSLPFTIVEPCAYIDNFLPGLRGHDPQITVPYDPDTPFGLISLRDVGEAAAHLLAGDSHIGATLEIGGPQLVTVRDVARAAEAVLGTEVALEVTSPRAWAAGQEHNGSGLDAREREWLTAMFAYYDRYGLPCGAAGIPAILGRDARGLDEVLAEELLVA